MSIVFKCACGKDFKVADELAGRKFRCSKCQTQGVVPMPAAPEPVLEEFALMPLDDEPPTRRFTSASAAASQVKNQPADESEPEPYVAEFAEHSVLDELNDYFPAAAPTPPAPSSYPSAPAPSIWQQKQAKRPMARRVNTSRPSRPSNLMSNISIAAGVFIIVVAIGAGSASADSNGAQKGAMGGGAAGAGAIIRGLLRRNWG